MAKVKPDIAIIGAGVVGTAIGLLAGRAGYPVVAVASRRRASAEQAARAIGEGVAVREPLEAAAMGGLLLLTVPDDALADLADQLARARAVRPGAVVAHCSGALPSRVLAPLEACGADLASMHPLQTFPTVASAVESLPGCYCLCEGAPAAVSRVMQLAADIGCVPVEIEPDRKTLYHAAACIACNYLATLQEAALAAAVLAGIGRDAARKALAPLVAATVRNVSELDTGAALTGPIARGDAQTVLRHLTALRHTDPTLADLYRQLGLRTVELAAKAGRIDPEQVRRLRQALE